MNTCAFPRPAADTPLAFGEADASRDACSIDEHQRTLRQHRGPELLLPGRAARRASRLSSIEAIARTACYKPRPGLHDRPTLFKLIGSVIGGLHLAPDHMCETPLGYLAADSLLGCPVPKGRPKTVRRHVYPQTAKAFGQRHVAQGLLARRREEKASKTECISGASEDIESSSRQGHPVLSVGLHARSRNGPNTLPEVNLGPGCTAHLSRTRCGQDCELESQRPGRRGQLAHPAKKGRDVAIRHRCKVLDLGPLPRQ